MIVAQHLAAVVAFVGGQELLGVHGTTLGEAGVLHGIVGVIGYLTVVAVLAVAAGSIIRSTAGGVATMCGLLLVAPTAGLLLVAMAAAALVLRRRDV